MTAAAIKVAKPLLRDFGEVDKLQVSRKGLANFVTAADIRTEKSLMAELKKARPEFGFLCEESGETPGKDGIHRWIIDPIDGTSNFIHAIPYFCISIGLEKKTDQGTEVIAGIIYDPVHNEMFVAEKGKGAFLNDYRIQTSRREQLEGAMCAASHLRKANGQTHMGFSRFDKLTENGVIIRYLGASALDLAYAACGRLDLTLHVDIKKWDLAAGLLLLREAGGLAVDQNGNPATLESTSLFCGNPNVHNLARPLLRGE